MFDALLALRGWRREDFETVTPEFLATVRHALVAERLAPVLADYASVLAINPSDVVPAQRVAVNRARLAASEQSALIRSILGLDEEVR